MTRAALLSRIDARLRQPTDEDATADLLVDLAEHLERELFMDTGHLVPAPLSPRLKEALRVIQLHPGVSGRQMADLLDISIHATHILIWRLHQRGLIRKEHGAGRTVHLFPVKP